MRVSLHSRLPAEDAAQRVLFAPAGQGAGAAGAGVSAAIYPGGHFRSEAHVARRLVHLDSRNAGGGHAGKRLQEFLRHENAFAPLAPEQRANLDAAGSGQAVFLLTGQQPGLLGGPILWYYKALTCAALARDWTARLGRPVIPVFWVAGDDADLDECNHVDLPDPRAAEVHGDLRLAFPDPERPLAMGERRVDDAQLRDLLKRLGAVWNPETLEQMGRAYPAPSSLSGGFLRLAQAQLGREGILFVDGYSRNLRALARPVLERAIGDWESWQASLRQGTASAAAAGIPAQVEIRDGVVHAFALRRGERHRLFGERKPGGQIIYAPDRPSHDLRADLAGMELTHDVFSRPLAADAVFPVLGHVLGPAELRYFAQLAPLFLETTGDMPLVQPRMTAAVAHEAAFQAFLGEGLDLPELVRFGPAALRARLTERTWRGHPASAAASLAPAEKWLEGVRKAHARHFRDAGPIERFERDLAASWKRYLRSLEKAAYSATAQSRQPLFDHLRWLGNGMGQDRHLNLGSLLNAIGREGLAKLRAVVDPLSTELQLIEYGGE
ncbi:MAG TPA: bacillithiol biosynthesis BshC [Fibrobacteria bacterium]|nr:bacillithiol biosynthesis BshC [Fibrobacteria bacterium]